MTILEAGLKPTVLEAAHAYLEAGCSILPLRGKQPAVKKWSYWQQYRPNEETLESWQRAGLLSGVGIICGKVSNNLVALDLDSYEALESFVEAFPLLVRSYAVASGSGRGVHFYYYVSHVPTTTVAPGYELRSDGAYVAAPPSPHPSGQIYRVISSNEVMHVSDLYDVVTWIRAKRPPSRPPSRPMPAPHETPTQNFTPREEYFRNLFVEAAINKQLEKLVYTPIGSRNRSLWGSAVALGQLVGSGALTEQRVESELLRVARLIGLEDTESLPTIKSGIERGVKSPRDIPPAPPLPKKN